MGIKKNGPPASFCITLDVMRFESMLLWRIALYKNALLLLIIIKKLVAAKMKKKMEDDRLLTFF